MNMLYILLLPTFTQVINFVFFCKALSLALVTVWHLKSLIIIILPN